MKKNAGVLFILLLFYSNVLGAEDVKKPSPAKDFEYDLNEEGTGVVIKKYLGKDVEVIIPEVIKTFPVVSIEHGAFSFVSIGDDGVFSYSGSESITIPDSVKVIGDYAFNDCRNLKTVTLGEGVERIGESAFSSSGLESITIPDSVKVIGGYAFNDCRNLKTVILGKGVERIGSYAFYSSGLESITIPDSVKEIEHSAFGFCSKLTTFNILTIRKINYDDFIFYDCPNLSDESKAKIEATGYAGHYYYGL